MLSSMKVALFKAKTVYGKEFGQQVTISTWDTSPTYLTIGRMIFRIQSRKRYGGSLKIKGSHLHLLDTHLSINTIQETLYGCHWSPQSKLPIIRISANHAIDDGSGSKMQSSMRCTTIGLNSELIFPVPELALHHTIISMKNIRITVIQCASGLLFFVLSLLIGVLVLI